MYELLAACERARTTPKPGPNSFTRAFIASVEKLLGPENRGSFATKKLEEDMQVRQHPPKLWDRLRHNERRHIHLERLDEGCTQAKEKLLQKRGPGLASLRLRFSLEQMDLTKQQLEKLGKALPDAFEASGIPLRQIYWSRMESVTGYVAHWKGKVAASKVNERRRRTSSDQASPSPGMEDSPAAKRRRISDVSPTAVRRKLSPLEVRDSENVVQETVLTPDPTDDSEGLEN
jgi:hypothetical protein